MDDQGTENGRTPTLGFVLIATWLCFVAAVIWRPHRGEYNPWLDAGLYNVPFSIAAFACCARAARDRVARRAWLALGIGLSLFVLGNLYGSLVVGDKDIYPSPADALWLLFYICVYIAIVEFVRSRVSHFYPSTWLDGAIAGFGAAAIVVAFALAPVLATTGGKLSVVATNLSYPTAEILLIIALVTAGTAMRSRMLPWWLLTIGIAVFCAGDVIYLFQESTDTYSEGGLLDISWPLGAVLIGLGACASSDSKTHPVEPNQRFVTPLVFTSSSLVLLVYGQAHALHPVAVGLTVAAVGAAILRTLLTVREVKALADSRREARTDPLTGLANRRAFIEQVEARLTREPPSAVMIIDLDGFKEVNDSLGHDVGDELLCAVADRLSTLFPAKTFARLGGDEFGAFVNATQPGDAVDFAQQVTKALEAPFSLADVLTRVRASIGIALSPLHGRRRGELLRFADIAMYEAKRAQSVVAIYDPSRDPNTKDRLQVIEELREAIGQRGLELHYQPTIDVASGRVHGVEALVRWPRADGSLLYPDSFIPLAERAGLIHILTRAVLEQAISFFQTRIRRANPGLRLSVNISGHDLVDEGLASYVGAMLDLHSVPADRLTLEITETAVVADIERAGRSITALRDLGVHVSIDDFGVGYSSMAQLVGLTVDELKIDKSFVINLDTDRRMEAIVRSTIELARALELNIVAEGVENGAALTVLHKLGCKIAQGYHIARPLTPDRLIRFLSTHRAGDAEDSVPLDEEENALHGPFEVGGWPKKAVNLAAELVSSTSLSTKASV